MNRFKLWTAAAALAAAGLAPPAAAQTTTIVYEDDVPVYSWDDGEAFYEDTSIFHAAGPALSIRYVAGWDAPHRRHRHHRGCAHGHPAAWPGPGHGHHRAWVRAYERGYRHGHRDSRRDPDRRHRGPRHDHRHGR